MLQIKNVSKKYVTGDLTQVALDDVSLSLRDNEFVAILGPSGSGKTTLLNVIGGLDRYDAGDLIINGVSTKKYKDRDWDSYRNHTIGFVFQSYNLIPHQTILSNVELALTISGISRRERRNRAKTALEKVGLGDQLHKRPNQMSGGQMQRVAIARALVNDPDVLLADEPTGALDSETSVQVMELLKEVARDRLVVMVTHNPELADTYATRIVRLRDGKITDDSDPYVVEEDDQVAPVHKNMGRASMSFFTALALSFNNLRTKKGRTILVAFAGSIGIIGIALIMSMSNGVNRYIKDLEEDTLSEYPLQITSTGLDISSMMDLDDVKDQEVGEGEVRVYNLITSMFSRFSSNDLASLKTYIDSGADGLDKYCNFVDYKYNVSPRIYRVDKKEVRQVNPDVTFASMGIGSSGISNGIMSSLMTTDVFHRMPSDPSLYVEQYDVKCGRWPENYNECVLVLSSRGGVSDFLLYTFGLRDSAELDELIEAFNNERPAEDIEYDDSYRYEDFVGVKFKLINVADLYEYDSSFNVWKDKSGDEKYLYDLVCRGEDITVVGAVQPKSGATANMLLMGISYPADLEAHVMSISADSAIVKDQLSDPDVNVITGKRFDDESKAFDMRSLFSIDEEAMQKAFSFDASSGLSFNDISKYFDFDALNSIDLSDLFDLTDLSFELPDLSKVDLSSLADEFDLEISFDSVSDIFGSLIDGYEKYAAEHPGFDVADLRDAFAGYLNSDRFKAKLSEKMMKALELAGDVTVSREKLSDLIRQIVSDFRTYAETNQFDDPAQFGQYLRDFIESKDIRSKVAASVKEIFIVSDDASLDEFQISAILSEMIDDYGAYAEENSLPTLSDVVGYFTDYLNTEDAGKIISDGVSSLLSGYDIESKMSDVLSRIISGSVGNLTESFAGALKDQITGAVGKLAAELSGGIASSLEGALGGLGSSMSDAVSFDPEAFASAIKFNMDENELSELLISMLSGTGMTYDGNIRNFGYAAQDKPAEIDLYPRDFESKGEIKNILDDYNKRMELAGEDDKIISYTDIVDTLMSSVTIIVNVVSYVLIAFVSISLVVSSIMIGVITYISVLERKKEIGILRAIGASKSNISQVFNAETFIIGLIAGAIGIGVTLLLLIPANFLIHYFTEQQNINASLPPLSGLILVALSVVLTLIGGLIPSRKAAKSDPVIALRSE